MSTVLLRNGRIIDPASGRDERGDLLLRDGVIAPRGHEAVDQEIDCSGLIVCPGFIDLHVAVRDPGYEEDETTATATSAALAGGFTTIAALPDTDPPVDNSAAAAYVALQAERAGNCRVLPLGAVTKDRLGNELADLGQLARAGAVGFSDAKSPIASAEIMRRALQYARMFDRPILTHPLDPTLSAEGVMHEGAVSTVLGLRGIPAAAEDIIAGRDVALAELTGGHVHLMTVTTRHAVDQVRRAKAAGLHVTCDVTPHHLALTDESLQTYSSAYKVMPPLRSREHVEALIVGLKEGVIDAISSDHRPWAAEKKDVELDRAPFGIVGLETLLPIIEETLIAPGHLTWLQLLEKLTVGPARILRKPLGTLAEGAIADVTVFDPEARWTIEPRLFRSKSRNSPFARRSVRGRIRYTLVGGEIRFQQS